MTTSTTVQSQSGPSPRARTLTTFVIGVVAGIVVAVLAVALWPTGDALAGRIDEDRFQAVILTNDKVYFGKIGDPGGEFFELQNAYFVRETRTADGAAPTRQVLPVSREIHTPENRMLIRRDEVVIIENLDPESEVLEQIQELEDSE